MKKYWAWFTYGDECYVIMFRVNGSLHYDPKITAFKDKDFYVRSIGEVIAMTAIDTHPINDKRFRVCGLCSHDYFRELRSRNYPRWTPKRPIIEWN